MPDSTVLDGAENSLFICPGSLTSQTRHQERKVLYSGLHVSVSDLG